MPRSRAEIIGELEAVAASLEPTPNSILQGKMEALIKELDRANRHNRSHDSVHRRMEMQCQYLSWATRHQLLADREKSASKAMAAMPRESPVNFTGDNAQAFWAHFSASVINNKALDNRQRMAHFLSRVKDHRDGATLAAGFNPDGSELNLCLQTFQEQYLDEKVLRVAALKRAQDVAPLTNMDDQVAVSAFIAEVRTLQNNLKEELGGQQYLEVTRILVSKIPVGVRRQFCRALAKEPHQPSSSTSETESAASKGTEARREVPVLTALVRHLEVERRAASWWRHLQIPDQKADVGVKRHEPGQNTLPAKRFDRKGLGTAAQECVICQSRSHKTTDCQAFHAEERKRALRRAGLCLRCLQHQFTPGEPCPNPKPCTRCGGTHHQVVCRSAATRATPNPSSAPKGVHVTTTTKDPPESRVYMSTISAVVQAGGQRAPVRVLLDSAAEASLITEDAVKRAGVSCGAADTLTLSGVTEGLQSTGRRAQLTVAATEGEFSFDITAYVVPRITASTVMTPSESIIEAARAKGIGIATPAQSSPTVDILIGQDWLFPFLAPEIVPLGPFIGALRSRLGWYVAGREGAADARGSKATVLECQSLCQDLAKIYEYVEPQELTSRRTASKPVEIFYDEEQAVYTVSLPRRSTEGLADNFRNAWAQVMALKRKLRATGQYETYDSTIKEYMAKGFAEVAPKANSDSSTYTIPHHAVWKKEAAKTKCRVVFNASSAVPGKESLNQCLEKGEPINADIWAVTMRFRLAPIVLVTDLVKAFSQIQIKEKDRDLLRYLWFAEPADVSPTVYRMKSVIFGAICSPHLLGAVLRDHTRRFQAEFPEVAEQMSRSMYMDDGIFVAEEAEQAKSLMKQAEAFFAKASFALHPWLTDSREVMTPEREFGSLDEEHKCLGLKWNPGTGTFRVKAVPASQEGEKVTRRQALSDLSKFYDPVSIFAPLKTAIRLFIRDLAASGKDWNDSLTDKEVKRWRGLRKQVQQVAEVAVPRGPRGKGLRALHVFGDASPQAYGAVVYLADIAGKERLLMGAQVKLAPKKFTTRAQEEQMRAAPSVTLPRLELMAAVMAVRLAEELLRLMPKETPVALYTDSDITLKRIQGDANRQDPFEMRRLQIIHEASDVAQWHHITTKQNPADLLTRECAVRSWLEGPLWWQGPDAAVAPLATPRERTVRQILVAQKAEMTDKEASVLKEPYSSALQKMQGIIEEETANGKTLLKANEGKERTLDAGHYSMFRLLELIQRQQFFRELERLSAGRPVHERSPLRLLSPFLDEWGLIRSRRPAQPQAVDWETRHPILLPRHPLVRDFVREEHRRLGHPGEANTRSHLAQHYHIIGARQLIKSVVRPCRECNIQRGKPFCPPEATLPAFRTLTADRPFTNVGMDYWGPLKVKGSSKVYGLLITCAVTRAVHLEIVTSLAARQCLNALMRFFARRGVPAEIHSDNATTFEAVNKALTKLAATIEELSKQEELAAHRIRWIFQTPRAPWFGAFFERMVGVTKKALQLTELRKASAIDDIRTIVIQVEALVNSRPLIEADDCGTVALTPAHFLIGSSFVATPPLPSKATLPSQGSLLEHYRSLCEERALLRKRLQSEYLTALRKHHHERNPTREPRLGEQVLISGEEGFEKDRFAWPIAQIMKLPRDKDGQIRRAVIRRGKSLLERPVKSLIPLEGVHEDAAPPGPGNVADESSPSREAVEIDGEPTAVDTVAA